LLSARPPGRLPCWFALRLLSAEQMGPWERSAARGAIPLTLLLSAFGLLCSASTLATRLCPGGRCFVGGSAGLAAGPHGLAPAAAAVPL
jgi:hypothetical protein